VRSSCLYSEWGDGVGGVFLVSFGCFRGVMRVFCVMWSPEHGEGSVTRSFVNLELSIRMRVLVSRSDSPHGHAIGFSRWNITLYPSFCIWVLDVVIIILRILYFQLTYYIIWTLSLGWFFVHLSLILRLWGEDTLYSWTTILYSAYLQYLLSL